MLCCNFKVAANIDRRCTRHWGPVGEFYSTTKYASIQWSMCVLTFCLQISLFCICAIVQGVGHVRWRRLTEAQRDKEWNLYGTFAATSCMGCISGALAYASRMFQLTLRYKADSLSSMPVRSLSALQQLNELRADQRRFTAAFYALFPIELAFVSVAYILALHRMQCFALQKSKHPMRWIIAGRIFLGAVVLCNFVGVCGNIAAAVSYNRAADFSSFAARAYAVNDTSAGRNFEAQARGAGEVSSVQRFCEVPLLSFPLPSRSNPKRNCR